MSHSVRRVSKERIVMSSIDSKLRRFEHNVINKAAMERDQMLAEIYEITEIRLYEKRKRNVYEGNGGCAEGSTDDHFCRQE